ncbi:MAG TPA: TadE family protein [Alphaproteobacteria bacterium]|nr:TadE family protein [Alphaproteobacteria bacterium]
MALRRLFARAGRDAARRSHARAIGYGGVIARLFLQRAGQVAVEFALVGTVFFVFSLAIIEVGLDLITLELMDDAAHDAARLIRIGTITGSSYSSALTTDVCNIVITIPSCSTTVQIYVAAAASGSPAGSGFLGLSYATVSGSTMTSTKATLATNSDVILEIGYSRPWAMQWIADVTGTTSTFLTTAFVFQTEPY